MCTRVLWKTENIGVLNGRTMDWSTSTEPKLRVFPAGLSHSGASYRNKIVVKGEPLEWTSQYKSIGITAYDIGCVDGFNEKGFAIHLLFFTGMEYGDREPDKKGVQVGLWGQYLLDKASSVSDALDLLQQIQPVMITIPYGKDEYQGTVHLAIEDETGDSAIIEYIDGKISIHHSPSYRVMANDPSYEVILFELKKWDFTYATCLTPLPGNVSSSDRFIRASYYLEHQKEPEDKEMGIASMFSIIRNVSVPFNAPHNTPDTIYNTEYRTVTDLNDKKYFFELTTAPSLIWVDLMDCEVTPKSVLELDPYEAGLIGDVTKKLKEVSAPF